MDIPTPSAIADAAFMAMALELGRGHLGIAAPNPSVGALAVRDGAIVGRGVTAPGGRPHAETEALRDAGAAARGATLYVTLEPCSHVGQTGPCADAIVAAGIVRVVSAMEDPDPRVSGRGHARLRAAGIAVEIGLAASEARRANLGYILRSTIGRPMVTLKLAETLDGFAAAGPHDPRLMITGAPANAATHAMRAAHDAIMAGIGTILADDALLTVRGPGLEGRKPLRVVLDARLALPPGSRMAQTAGEAPVLLLCGEAASRDCAAALAARGIEIARVAMDAAGRIDLAAALRELARRGITRVFCEGGPRVAASLLAQGLADEAVLLTGARPFGGAGVPAMSPESRRILDARYLLAADGPCGHDRLRRYERRA